MKIFTVFLVGLFVIFGLAGQSSAETQITSTGTNYGSSTLKISPVDEGIWVATAQQMGIRVVHCPGPSIELAGADLPRKILTVSQADNGK